MIHVPVDQAAATLDAHFEADLAALLATHSIVGADPSLTVYPRRSAELFTALKNHRLPGCGVYALHVRTQARVQGIRDNRLRITFDYFARGADPEVLTAQCELAAEALLQTIDRLAGFDPNDQFIGAGEEELGITVDLLGAAQAEGSKLFEDRLLVTCPSTYRSTGL